MPRSDRKDTGRYKSLTKQEVTAELQKSGILPTIDHVNLFLTWGEVEGIVCSGIDKGKKTTYALLDERVPPTRELCREEALRDWHPDIFKATPLPSYRILFGGPG